MCLLTPLWYILSVRTNDTYVHQVHGYEKLYCTILHKIFKTLIRMFFYSAETKQPESQKRHSHTRELKQPVAS